MGEEGGGSGDLGFCTGGGSITGAGLISGEPSLKLSAGRGDNMGEPEGEKSSIALGLAYGTPKAGCTWGAPPGLELAAGREDGMGELKGEKSSKPN